jgi:hypothetical protein
LVGDDSVRPGILGSEAEEPGTVGIKEMDNEETKEDKGIIEEANVVRFRKLGSELTQQ